MDATYRADLRELNELNFQRFDAKLEERLAQMDARWERRFAELDASVDRRLARLETTLERGLKEQTRWMFLAWASLLIPVVGLWMRG